MFILFWSGPKWCMVNFSQIRLKRLNASGHLVVTNFSKSCWTVTKFNYVLFGFLKSHILPVIVIWNDRLETYISICDEKRKLFALLAKTPILEMLACVVVVVRWTFVQLWFFLNLRSIKWDTLQRHTYLPIQLLVTWSCAIINIIKKLTVWYKNSTWLICILQPNSFG